MQLVVVGTQELESKQYPESHELQRLTLLEQSRQDPVHFASHFEFNRKYPSMHAVHAVELVQVKQFVIVVLSQVVDFKQNPVLQEVQDVGVGPQVAQELEHLTLQVPSANKYPLKQSIQTLPILQIEQFSTSFGRQLFPLRQ